MKVQIRNAAFDSNSSSLHSLVVMKTNEYYDEEELRKDMYLYEDGKWKIWDDNLSFGRSPFECLATFESKVRYAIASLCGYRKNAAEIFESIESIVCEVIPGTYIELPKVSWWDSEKEEIDYGHVDENILSGFLEKENITLKEFLTNKRYIVIVDGDEYCIYQSMKKAGIIKTEVIDREYYGGEYIDRNNYYEETD